MHRKHMNEASRAMLEQMAKSHHESPASQARFLLSGIGDAVANFIEAEMALPKPPHLGTVAASITTGMVAIIGTHVLFHAKEGAVAKTAETLTSLFTVRMKQLAKELEDFREDNKTKKEHSPANSDDPPSMSLLGMAMRGRDTADVLDEVLGDAIEIDISAGQPSIEEQLKAAGINADEHFAKLYQPMHEVLETWMKSQEHPDGNKMIHNVGTTLGNLVAFFLNIITKRGSEVVAVEELTDMIRTTALGAMALYIKTGRPGI